MRTVTFLRVVAAMLIVTHGVARAVLGIVDDFGGFLDVTGFPFGVGIAWLVTIVEIVGGTVLAAGYLVRPLCGWFVIELLTGIALVHARDGWFVVGAGRNGMEYSVLLIAVLIAVAVGHRAGSATPSDR